MSLRWDPYSDQPDIIRDKQYKKSIYKRVVWDFFKMVLTNLIIFPISLIHYLIFPAKKSVVKTDEFFGIGVNLDKRPEDTIGLIEDLGINALIIRIPLHDIENLDQYVRFIGQFKEKKKDIIVNILQDRRHVEDSKRLYDSLNSIFKAIYPITKRVQIGNAINRKKWAIFSMDEYASFYKIAYQLKQQKYPQLKLLGSSVIDFEYYFTIRTLFNLRQIKYDQFSSLLYVDRRGAPENKQLGMGLISKLYLLQSIIRLSSKVNYKTTPDIIITETNWPIENTKPYAPTSGTECVSLEDHANYLVRYYLLVLSSQAVKQVFWHQLIAPGYGLIDHREEQLVKYPAYFALKTMIGCLSGLSFKTLIQDQQIYRAIFQSENTKVEAVWSLEPTCITFDGQKVVSRDGDVIFSHSDEKKKKLKNKTIDINQSPIYLIS